MLPLCYFNNEHLNTMTNKIGIMSKKNEPKPIEHPKILLCNAYFSNRVLHNTTARDTYEKSINRLKFLCQSRGTVAQYDRELNIIGFISGKYLKELAIYNNVSIEKQVARTLSHELFHAVLHLEHGNDDIRICGGIDFPYRDCISLAEYLKEYGIW